MGESYISKKFHIPTQTEMLICRCEYLISNWLVRPNRNPFRILFDKQHKLINSARNNLADSRARKLIANADPVQQLQNLIKYQKLTGLCFHTFAGKPNNEFAHHLPLN